ncbi:MAG: hypothetical protein ACJ8M1_10995 [Chthoniobacterales bacterium]
MSGALRGAFATLITLAAFGTGVANAAEIRLSLAPKISLPKDSPAYSEDTVDFYGTNMALLTSGLLRTRAEAQLHQTVPASLRIQATRIANTSIISLTTSGGDESLANGVLAAVVDQFLRFKREQKAKYYRDAINAVDAALSYVPAEYAKHLEDYKERLVIASILDTKPAFEKIDY